jgi:hypothetical protein
VQTYSCYIHRHSSMTPERRVLLCESREALVEDIRELIGNWPDLQAVEIYDDADKLLLRFKGSQLLQPN